MQSTDSKDDSKIIEIDTKHQKPLVFFSEDGNEVFGRGGDDEEMLQRWRVSDGGEVGQAIQATERRDISAAALSLDCKWWVCVLGPSTDVLQQGTSRVWNVEVWDAQTGNKALDISPGLHDGGASSIDISPDSTKFAVAGGSGKTASIWSMTTGKVLASVPYGEVMATRFSPSGDRIATATRTVTGYVNPPQSGYNSYYSSGYNNYHYSEYQSQTPPDPQPKYGYSIRVYNCDNGQQLLNISSGQALTTSLAWSAKGHQLFAVQGSQVKRFDTSSGSLLKGKWYIQANFIILSHNEKFIAAFSGNALSFWDARVQKEIGTTINHDSQILSIALSSGDDRVATGEHNGRITVWHLYSVLPPSFLTLNLPLVHVKDAVFKPWKRGDFSRVEELLTEELALSSDPLYRACTLANRALARARLGQCHTAVDDAKESIETRRTVVGHIANTVAQLRKGEYDSAMHAFDLVFSDGFATEHNILLLFKAIILFEYGKPDVAMSRVDALIDIVDDKSLYVTARAYMLLLLGGVSLRDGDNERAIEFLERAREAIPFEKSSYLVIIFLIVGWDFDKLAFTIQLQFQECIKPIEAEGDAAMEPENPGDAIPQYSRALTLDPLDPARLLIKRSKAHGMLGSWDDALKDADEAIKADPKNPWGCERRHAALHALQRYDEAVDTFTRMFSLFEESPDEAIRQLGKKYVSPSRLETTIESVVRGVFKICPSVLIDVQSGRLCDGPERLSIFKSESQFKELVSSMTEELDDNRTLRVVARYFQYVMFSDIWEEKEASFQDVNMAASVWDLDSSPSNEKLKKFCRIVREDGYRWAWSDTCVDKAINTVLTQSLTMMYKWYEASAATLVRLASVPSPSSPGDLTNSIWMTQANTLQVALAPKVIRFYDRDWEPYLGDTRANHKESTEIAKELADAIGASHETIISFDPDYLGVREKLRLASTRNATVEEDTAYSLIGIFKSDIQPHYGEGDVALGHLLEEIVARSGDVTVLSWTGKPSPYNSCLPASLAVYGRPPCTFPAIEDAEMDERVATLRSSLSRTHAMLIYDRVTRLPPARFANRRLHLPSIIFAVKKLNAQDSTIGEENRYRARVSGIGHVEFKTSDSLFTEPFKLIFVHPWIRDLRDSFDAFSWESDPEVDEYEYKSSRETAFESAPSSPSRSSPLEVPPTSMDDYTRALRMIVRLRQPFHGLLLQQQRNGQFKRVATEHEIVLPGIDRSISFARDVRTEVVEIL